MIIVVVVVELLAMHVYQGSIGKNVIPVGLGEQLHRHVIIFKRLDFSNKPSFMFCVQVIKFLLCLVDNCD
jgi:hypothetical protein